MKKFRLAFLIHLRFVKLFRNLIKKHLGQEVLWNKSQNHESQWRCTSDLWICFLKCEYFHFKYLHFVSLYSYWFLNLIATFSRITDCFLIIWMILIKLIKVENIVRIIFHVENIFENVLEIAPITNRLNYHILFKLTFSIPWYARANIYLSIRVSNIDILPWRLKNLPIFFILKILKIIKFIW